MIPQMGKIEDESANGGGDNDGEEKDDKVYPFESLIDTGLKMTIHHKYYLCKNLCSSPHLSQPIK